MPQKQKLEERSSQDPQGDFKTFSSDWFWQSCAHQRRWHLRRRNLKAHKGEPERNVRNGPADHQAHWQLAPNMKCRARSSPSNVVINLVAAGCKQLA